MIKNLSITGAVAVAIVFGVLLLKQPTVISQLGNQVAPVVNVPAPVVNVEAAKVNVPAPIVNVNVPKQDVKLGAVASPDLPTPWFSFGGVSQWAGRMESLTQGSSTVCAIQAPSSTSTLAHGSIKFSLASTSAVSLDLAKGTTQYATTTKIGTTYYIGASAQATIVASSTGSVAGDGTIFGPNEWFVVRLNQWSASSGAGNAPVGVCNALWFRI